MLLRMYFGKFENVQCMILKKEVTDEQFEIIKNTIDHFIENPKQYKYDYANLFLAKTKITASHENRFFCSEFVAYLLQTAGLEIPNVIEKIRPTEFEKLKGAEVIYKGELKAWCGPKQRGEEVVLA